GPSWRIAFGHEQAEGPHEGAALQRGEAARNQRPLADDEGAAPASRRREELTRAKCSALRAERTGHARLRRTCPFRRPWKVNGFPDRPCAARPSRAVGGTFS